ncbi:MAG TPA: bacillithiol biosynthesis cysteine-adding enzyme BshC, partial [Ignavibacteria bacterium]|nr:bacillithiol biosynthesis cysteine-adding enzyme BshC [Ignavibacteria bacterium]
MPIPYNLLPTYSELFLTYINDFEKLRKYFEFDFRNYEEIFKCIDLKRQTYQTGKNFFRNDLCNILKEQNEKFDSGEVTFENIKLLSSHDTFAVVTGQQLGFLTGPYYTILKAINTIQLAEKLNNKFPEFKFVPVFWLEGDDHDFPEINNVNIISRENEIKNIKYFENGSEQEKYLKPAGNILLDKFIDDFINDIEGSLNKTDFTENVFNDIRNAYKEGVDIKTAFTVYLNSVLKNKGLIFIDPTDIRLKNFLKPVFEKELTTFPAVCEAVINTTVDLEEKYSAQVKPKAINLFYIHDGNRYLLEPRDNEIFALKNSRQKFSREELFNILESNPERFSWNVVTRPVCQDYLLPTVAYIGGPSEIAYFAQFKEVYRLNELTMPVIYPRTSVTIIENRVQSFLDKYNLQFEELFNLKEVSKKLLKNESEADIDEIFSQMNEELTAIFYSNEKLLSKIDENQTASFGKRNQQFLDSLNVAKEKFQSTQLKQNEVISNQLKKALTNIFPGEILQERIINVIYFLNKYDNGLIEKMINEIKVDEFSHQLLHTDLIT